MKVYTFKVIVAVTDEQDFTDSMIVQAIADYTDTAIAEVKETKEPININIED